MKTLLIIAVTVLCASCGSEEAKRFGGLTSDAAAVGDSASGGRLGSDGNSTGGGPGTAASSGGSSNGGARASGGATSSGGASSAGGAGGAGILPCPADEIGFGFNQACPGYGRCHSNCELLGKHVSGCAGGPTGRSCVDNCGQCTP